MVSTPQEAEELVAFLNYCGMDEFTRPVDAARLTPALNIHTFVVPAPL